MGRRPGFAALVATGALACGGDGSANDPGDPAPCGGAALELEPGTGTEGFVPLATGDPVGMVHGPQGGWHVNLAGLVRGSPPDVIVEPRVVVTDLADLPIVGEQEPSYVALAGYDAAACEGTFYDIRGFLQTSQGEVSDQDFVCTLRGRSLRMDLTVSEFDTGRSATAGVDVVAELDPADVPVCDNPGLQVGLGEGASFAPLASEDPLPIHRDADGTWFVEVGGRVRRSGPEVTVHLALGVPHLGDLPLAGAQPPTPVTLTGHDPAIAGGQGWFAGVRAALDPGPGSTTGDPVVCGLDGRDVSLEVTVAEVGTGRAVTAGLRLAAALDPAAVAAGCGG